MTTTPQQSPQQSRIAPQPLPRWERVLSAIAPSLTTVALAFGAPVHPSLRTSRHRQG